MRYRLILIWMNGGYGYKKKWPKRAIDDISILLQQLNSQKPKEIHRAVRGLKDIKFWKGTEFRAFLLYFGFVILKPHLPPAEYDHFVLLSCAVRICMTNVYKPYLEIARKWFDQYIDQYIDLYGSHSIGSNVHNLHHVIDDVQNLGCLMDISTYPFENRLQFLKSKVKHPNLPLQQITRRLVEMSIDYDVLYLSSASKNSIFPQLRFPFKLNNTFCYKEIQIDTDCTLSCLKVANSWFLTNSNEIVRMNYAFRQNNDILIYGEPVKERVAFFTYPVTSSRLHIFKSDGKTDNIRAFKLENIKSKMISLSINGSEMVFMPLLHTLKYI